MSGDPNNVQRSDGGEGTPLNTQPLLPLIDGHCHIFGHSIFEGGDLIDLGASDSSSGTRKFLAYTIKRDGDNARTVLGGAVKALGSKQRPGSDIKKQPVAAVPLLLDQGYTPLAVMHLESIRARAQEVMTEPEQQQRTDHTRRSHDTSNAYTLRLESLYCVKTEDRTGDDHIRIEVFENNKLIRVLGPFEFDDHHMERQINQEIRIPAPARGTPTIQVKLFEVDDYDPNDHLGTVRLADMDKTGWQEAVYQPAAHREGTRYQLTYSVQRPEAASSQSATAGQGNAKWMIELIELKCIEQEDLTGKDSIRIEISTKGADGKSKTHNAQFLGDDGKPMASIAASKGSSFPARATQEIHSTGAVITMFEVDTISDDKLGSWAVNAEEVYDAIATFKEDDAHYELRYNVVRGTTVRDDGYYPSDERYLWFRRDAETYRGTIRSLARAASEFPGQVWPLVSFDPRRPDGLDFVKEAIEKLGFVGIKLYSRCGWMPWNNREIYGDTLGNQLDGRLDKLFAYCASNGIPLLNHTSPTGYPPNNQLVFPAAYHKGTNILPKHSGGVDFPPLADLRPPRANYGIAAIDHEIARCAHWFCSYLHYVQKTVSPYQWEPVFAKHSKLRLCFAHSGGENSVYHRYRDELTTALNVDDDLRRNFKKAEIMHKDAGIAQSLMVGPGRTVQEGFISYLKTQMKLHFYKDRDQSERFTSKQVFDRIPEYIDSNTALRSWLDSWANAYPDDWTTRIIKLQKQYEGVYADIAYLSGGEEPVFCKMIEQLVKDAHPDLSVVPGFTHEGRRYSTESGEIMLTKHFIGTDWFMTEMDGMDAHAFWARVQKVFKDQLKVEDVWEDKKLWPRWAITNCLDWLNLKPRLSGEGMNKLKEFYNWSHGKKAGAKDQVPLPTFWNDVEAYYDEKSGK